ncbi:MATE family efflux transporter [Anaerotignum sp. MB30-C6]|uniref:MATE family efflux transporter n=1 Tax=Anaerotignum sp. MB30-C6 TaxID=3070814 RepID=UPI0027DD3768|nr:MATE family efflux transporter [Anaerotignum sp. MB30-C6]WMI81141.1 MATE family efflux transporter [Anaerotignum sp. MB30-C6]
MNQNEIDLSKTTSGKNELGVLPVKSLLVKLAVPAIAAQIVNVLYNIVDRMYIGHIPETGALALTGVGVCMPLIMLVAAFAALASMGGAPRSSILLGKGDKKEAERTLGNCTMLLIILAIVLTVILLLYSEPLLLAFGASENTIGFALDYMRIYALGTIFVQLSLGLNAFISAQGFAKVSMQTILIGAIINIILDPIFIFFFGMGVKGAALATVISQAISAIWVVVFLTGKGTTLKLRLKNFRIHGRTLWPCVLLGLSPFIMQSTESIISICFNSSLLRYGGDTAVGAMTILSSVMQFSMLPLIGLAQGAQPITGYNFGARKPQRVREGFGLLLKYSLIYSMTLWAIVMLFPRVVASIFSNDVALLDYSAWAIRYYMFFAGVFGIQIACQQTFIAIGNAKTSLFLAILRKILLLIPLIYLLPMFIEDKAKGVFLAEPVADMIAVTTTAILFTIQFKKAMSKLEDEKAMA